MALGAFVGGSWRTSPAVWGRLVPSACHYFSNHVDMNPPSREDLRGRLLALLIDMEDRLLPQTCGYVQEFIDVGEYGLALETMADMLSEAASPITVDERDRMLGLAEAMKMGDRVSECLVLCPTRP